ncbi:hypothetical protein WSS_A21973 [Rhodococcus opacus M213]|uniref:Uncharacterized protein n=1 Tax=Rhodococcus opacus M213 TaxID=1129896 RepID=K8XQP0_RHOOP|nr:hypothetical protein [Rhodococcus opacus]EKT80487.1 hypothetical protein WSS_A21973 [Rhodococcus opacus M213]
MTTNLPQSTSGGGSSTPMPFTRTGRLERNTRHAADEIAAAGYLDLFRTQVATQKGAEKVSGALIVEGAGLAGLADLGDAVDARLEGASALARRLVSEALPGSTRRIMNIVDAEIRNIAQQ